MKLLKTIINNSSLNLSLASLIAVSGKPALLNEGIPGIQVTSTLLLLYHSGRFIRILKSDSREAVPGTASPAFRCCTGPQRNARNQRPTLHSTYFGKCQALVGHPWIEKALLSRGRSFCDPSFFNANGDRPPDTYKPSSGR